MENRTVSVIIPVYNVKEYLDTCISSVKAQTYTDLEVILIDDGSADGSAELCDGYAAGDSRFKVIHQENAGASKARNRGLSAASGAYVAFLDSDDWLEPDAYETLTDLLERENTDVAFGLGERVYRTELNRKPDGKITVLEEKEILDAYILDEIQYPPMQKALWDKLYRRELIGELRLPESIVTGEDGVFNTKIFCRAKKAAFIGKIIYHYRDERPGNISSTRVTDRIFKDRIPAMLQQIEDLKQAGRPELARYKILAFYRELQRLYWKTCCSGNPQKKRIMRELLAYFRGRKKEIRESFRYEGASFGYRLKMESFLVSPVFYCLYMKWKG